MKKAVVKNEDGGIVAARVVTLKVSLLVLCIFSCVQHCFGQDAPEETRNYSKGPLYGKNLYVPYLIHYTFPSLPAASGTPDDFRYHTSLYLVQDARYVKNNPLPPAGERTYDKENIERDYESIVGEAGFSYNLRRTVQLGIDMRLIAYYNGFWDGVVEDFHGFFGFPNGRREFFEQNRLYIDIPNDNGIPLFLDKETVSFGDIDLWGKYTFFEAPRLSLAALGAFKLPTGRLKDLSGSNYPDVGIVLLSDIQALWWLTVYVSAGVVVPFAPKSYPMFNGLSGVEFHPWKSFSFNLQMNIKTPAISGYKYSWPQTNLLVGFKVRHADFEWQFYFEEDPFTNQGTDLTLSFLFSHTLHKKAPRVDFSVN